MYFKILCTGSFGWCVVPYWFVARQRAGLKDFFLDKTSCNKLVDCHPSTENLWEVSKVTQLVQDCWPLSLIFSLHFFSFYIFGSKKKWELSKPHTAGSHYCCMAQDSSNRASLTAQKMIEKNNYVRNFLMKYSNPNFWKQIKYFFAEQFFLSWTQNIKKLRLLLIYIFVGSQENPSVNI